MFIEHQGKRPRIHPTAYVAPSAVISGDVEIGEESRILHGAVLTAEGALVSVGSHCVVMEHAVIRGACGKARLFPASIGDYTLIGPHAYLVGCTVEDRCFVATGAIIFNCAHLKRGSEVTLQGIVHVGSTLEEEQWVPLQHIAIGTPATIFAPGETDAMMEALRSQGFASVVFGVERQGKTNGHVVEQFLTKYVRALAAHRMDAMLPDAGGEDVE
jgi:carbonic anhydrase/acetyltransferase-like protein (isoleucine patch superfamily)